MTLSSAGGGQMRVLVTLGCFSDSSRMSASEETALHMPKKMCDIILHNFLFIFLYIKCQHKALSFYSIFFV